MPASRSVPPGTDRTVDRITGLVVWSRDRTRSGRLPGVQVSGSWLGTGRASNRVATEECPAGRSPLRRYCRGRGEQAADRGLPGV